MKKNKVLTIASVIGALALMVGGVMVADASNSRNYNNNLEARNTISEDGSRFGRMLGLSDEERIEKMVEVEARRGANRAQMETRREAMFAAMESGSYKEWKSVVGENHPMASQITEENFASFAEAHENMESRESVHEKLAEMGIVVEGRQGMGKGMGRGMGVGGCHMNQ